MIVRPLRFVCGCGKAAEFVTEVGTTQDMKLYAEWPCPDCVKMVRSALALESLIAFCPTGPPPDQPFALIPAPLLTDQDLAVLKAMHILDEDSSSQGGGQ